MTDFNQFGLPAQLIKSLTNHNFTTPTPIQEQAIPLALAGRDILGTAQTGTGKTGAFGIPLVAKLLSDPKAAALIMTPTRELAFQVMTQIKAFLGHDRAVRAALLIGGEPMPKQYSQLKWGPRIIVGTPGRINDHLERGTLDLSNTNFLVLDEADRMLDMGFGVQLELIAEFLPEKRQTLMFSATLPPNIVNLSRKYLTNPERISVGSTTTAAPKIKQELIHTSEDEKHDHLTRLLNGREGTILVFVKTKHGADRLARRLSREEHNADAIHGDLRQGQRDRVIRLFREKECRILVATDVAARGLDIPHIETVINYDLPQCPEDYIHRVGRTARNGAEGEAICLIAPMDRAKWNAIDRLINPDSRSKGERFDSGREGGNRRGSGGHKFGGAPRTGKFGFKIKDKPEGGRSSYGDRSSSGENRGFAKSGFSRPAPRREGGDWTPVERNENSPPRSADSGDRRDFKPRFGSGDRKPEGRRFEGSRPEGDRPARSYSPRPEGGNSERPFVKKFGSDDRKKSFGDKPFFKDGPKKDWSAKKPEGRKFDTPRSEGDRSSRPDRPYNPRPEGGNSERPFVKKFGNDDRKKSFGDKPFFKDGPKKDFVKKDGVKKDWSGKKPEGRSEAPASGGKKFFGDKTNSRTGPSQGPFRPRRTAA
jgi:ATP-dependent RNA helicase DeaD